jgi:pseudaminic acid biosynthesis-associated methylase
LAITELSSVNDKPKEGQKHLSGSSDGAETVQAAVWKSEFGRDYTNRNTFDPEALDRIYRKNYGVPRREINESSLGDIAKGASFLEVGCNTGNQLLLLQQMGYGNLSGVELQPYALEIASRRLRDVSLRSGSALDLPYADSSFDVVFTSGVLIHIAPKDLPHALDEIYRCSRAYIWGMEYFAPDVSEVSYRDHCGLLWKMDYSRCYLDRFTDLELVRERRLPYLENANVDTVFLLRKKLPRV